MSIKTLVLSSAGLKNLVENINTESKEFTFIFGEEKLRTSNFVAEFLSPKVSKLHQTDPTIDCVCFSNEINKINVDGEEYLTNLFKKDNLNQIIKLMKGDSIEVGSEEIQDLQLISLLLENDELFTKLNELYPIPPENEEKYIDHIIKQLPIYEHFGKIAHAMNIDYSFIIDQISKQFYRIDKQKLKQLPQSILYQIISNKNLVVESEDSLFDFITDIFPDSSDENIYSFFETVKLH